MKTFDGKVAPWYIALFVAMLMAIAGLYVWVVPGAGADQSFVAGLILIAAACCGVVTGAPIVRNRVEVRVPAPGRPSEGSSESRGDSREGDRKEMLCGARKRWLPTWRNPASMWCSESCAPESRLRISKRWSVVAR